MNDSLQTYIRKVDKQIREWDRLMDDLEMRAYREKIDGKIMVYREIGYLRRRKEDALRKLDALRSAVDEGAAAARR